MTVAKDIVALAPIVARCFRQHQGHEDFRGAIAAQRQLVAAYPDSQKVPDALLNIASAQIELGDNGGARKTLEEIVAKYPTSEAAGKARQRLTGR